MGRFLLFITASLLWHGIQWALFNTVFKVQAPSLSNDGGRTLHVSMESVVRSSLIAPYAMEKQSRPSREPLEPMDAGPKRPTLAKSTPHLANITERLTPLESQPIRPSTSSLTSPLSEPEETSVRVNDQQLPFSFGGEVKKRKVIKAPPLPEYPPWALSAAVELTLTVALEVNPHGVPERVFIKEGCGDSATDLVVIQYVEQLRFQPSLSRSQGELDWSFRLKR